MILDLSESEADKVLATFDPLSAMAQVNSVALDSLLRNVQTGSEALASMLSELHSKNIEELSDSEATNAEQEKLDKAIQLEPGREYVVIMANDDIEWEEMKAALQLGVVRRGGYKHGSAFDAVGTQRVLTWEMLKAFLK